jgi:hypothetical protein
LSGSLGDAAIFGGRRVGGGRWFEERGEFFSSRDKTTTYETFFYGRWVLSGLFDGRNGLFTYHGLWTITSSSRIISRDYICHVLERQDTGKHNLNLVSQASSKIYF